MVRTWDIGDVRVMVETPEGVSVVGASVEIAPENREQFLRAAEAVGGLERLRLPTSDQGYRQAAYVYAQDGEGEDDFVVSVSITEPPRPAESMPAPAHPFFSKIAERVERDA